MSRILQIHHVNRHAVTIKNVILSTKIEFTTLGKGADEKKEPNNSQTSITKISWQYASVDLVRNHGKTIFIHVQMYTIKRGTSTYRSRYLDEEWYKSKLSGLTETYLKLSLGI